ncbi:gluconokinase [Luteolibacter algae]|uniref:Gluconokinase n=1 Tax=Luteolibacter algae TaxID=454151 RepID=A0ABW5DB32_9BACT
MDPTSPRVLVIMGVSGSGKTTVGLLLAARHGGRFFDADDFHPPENIAKMSSGIALDDDDRGPWLDRLRTEVIEKAAVGSLTVLACSALKNAYRKRLGLDQPCVSVVFLSGDSATLLARLESRSGHYMKSSLLDSQLGALEVPSQTEALHISIAEQPETIVETIEKHFHIR